VRLSWGLYIITGRDSTLCQTLMIRHQSEAFAAKKTAFAGFILNPCSYLVFAVVVVPVDAVVVTASEAVGVTAAAVEAA